MTKPKANRKKIVGSVESLPTRIFKFWMCYWWDMSYNAILFAADDDNNRPPVWDDEDGWVAKESTVVAVDPEILEAMGVKPIEWSDGDKYFNASCCVGMYTDLFLIELTLPHVDGVPMLPTYEP